MSTVVPMEGADIGRIAERRLRESPYYFLKNLHCDFEAGTLTLYGAVPLKPLRQLAESIVRRIVGVHEVVNCVEVVDPAQLPFVVRALRDAG